MPGPRLGTRVRPRVDWNNFDPDVLRWRLEAGVDERIVPDLVELRTVIKPAAARIAAIAATAEDVAACETACAAMEHATDGGGSYLQADLDFHHRLLLATHNRFVVGMAPVFSAMLEVSFRLSAASLAGAKAALPMHRRVLDEIIARDDLAGALRGRHPRRAALPA
ncbi:MAG: FCD domain-containing protein [Betaproteobacteria bacterium]|nr:FCD domain-containing protein [Betaproteobacteria bacterium]